MYQDARKKKNIKKQISGGIPAKDQKKKQFQLPVQPCLDKEKGQHAK
jgi:hypothetical protein